MGLASFYSYAFLLGLAEKTKHRLSGNFAVKVLLMLISIYKLQTGRECLVKVIKMDIEAITLEEPWNIQ